MEIKDRQERLKKTIAFLKFKNLIINQKDLAVKLDINANSISQAVSGNKSYLSDSLFKKLSFKFDVLNIEWLLKGDGNIEKDKPSISSQNNNSKVDEGLESYTPERILDYILRNGSKFRKESKIEAVIALLGSYEQHKILQDAYDKAEEANNLIEQLKNKTQS